MLLKIEPKVWSDSSRSHTHSRSAARAVATESRRRSLHGSAARCDRGCEKRSLPLRSTGRARSACAHRADRGGRPHRQPRLCRRLRGSTLSESAASWPFQRRLDRAGRRCVLQEPRRSGLQGCHRRGPSRMEGLSQMLHPHCADHRPFSVYQGGTQTASVRARQSVTQRSVSCTSINGSRSCREPT